MAKRNTNNGSFKKGNPGGPGRPKRVTEIAYAKAVIDACPLSEWETIVKATVEQAKGGDGKAREWLARHLIGETPMRPSLVLANEAFDPTGETMIAELIVDWFPDKLDLLLGTKLENLAKAKQLLTGNDPDDESD